jgi:hypothetical protein
MSFKNGSGDESKQMTPEPATPTLEPENSVPPNTLETKTRAVTGFKWILVCAGLYSAIFLYGLDNTIAADIQSAILETYGEISQLAWIGIGFPLGSVVTILPV